MYGPERYILMRLQEIRVQVEQRIMRAPRFRALCRDYGEAVDAEERLRHSQTPGALAHSEEYRTLIAELEAEILNEIKRDDQPT